MPAGDHKQLRPKVESYHLSVQAGRGHTLNVSLFERLVLSGMPHTTLAVQHRMHPDISKLIKHTYPALQVSRLCMLVGRSCSALLQMVDLFQQCLAQCVALCTGPQFSMLRSSASLRPGHANLHSKGSVQV